MPKAKEKDTRFTNLKFILAKLAAAKEKRDEIDKVLVPLLGELKSLEKAAEGLAGEIWEGFVARTAQEWKSARGEEDVTLEWADEQYSRMPEEVNALVDGTLVDFYAEVEERIRGEE